MNDEVVVHFRVTGLVTAGDVERVLLETIHNKNARNVRGTTKELAEVAEEVAPLAIETGPFRVILQRKAPKAPVPAPGA